MRSFDEIINFMLGLIPSKYDKREGSFIYDAVAPSAKALEYALGEVDKVEEKLDIENLFGDELEAYVYQRTGAKRLPATKAIGTLTASGNGVITIGDLFETESGIQFKATETVTISATGEVSIEAVLPGPSGNVPAEQITKIPITISGITNVTNANQTSDGFEEESDEALKTRYYERRRTPATSGNKAHYINWAKEVPGIGGAKVFSLWNGDNTVKVVVIDADKHPASLALVEEVQEYIDPGSRGQGEGQAPMGAYCTVESAVALSIDVNVTITRDPAYTLAETEENISSAIDNYLKSIALESEYVSYSNIGALIQFSNGVLDYSSLTINGGTTSILILSNEVAILGTVVVNE